MSKARITLGIAAAGLALAGVVSLDSSTSEAKKKKPRGAKLRITDGDFGPILTNGSGRALYLFTADRRKTSNCAGDCAVAWPPYIVKAKPLAGKGVRPGLIGTTRRADGRLQATYRDHPVYFYEADNERGEVLCQAVYEFGGFWYVLRANGKAVR